MDFAILLINYIASPLLFINLFIVLPPYIIYKFIQSILRIFSEEDLTGKVVLITGASSGIGENLAYEYAKRGARLVLVARRENVLRVVAKKARANGSPEVIVVAADVSKCEDCKRSIDETINHFGRLDHLVNNAGITSFGRFQDTKNIENLTPLMDINFWGSIYPTHFALPYLEKSKGKIIVNSSMSGFLPTKTSFYGATKAALISFYEALRVELGSKVKITIICPSFTETEMTRGKHLAYSGETEVDRAHADRIIGNLPMRTAKECAEDIVKGVCRGYSYVLDSGFWQILVLWNQLAPDLFQGIMRLMYYS